MDPQEQLSITFVLSSYAHTHFTTLLTECRAMWVNYESLRMALGHLSSSFMKLYVLINSLQSSLHMNYSRQSQHCLHISSSMKSTCPRNKKHSSISGFGKYCGDYYFPHNQLCPKLKHHFVFHGVNPLSMHMWLCLTSFPYGEWFSYKHIEKIYVYHMKHKTRSFHMWHCVGLCKFSS